MKKFAFLLIIVVVVVGVFFYAKGEKSEVNDKDGQDQAAGDQKLYEVKFKKEDFKGTAVEIEKTLEEEKTSEDSHFYYIASKSYLEIGNTEKAEKYASILIERFSKRIDGQENALLLGRDFHKRFAADAKSKDYWTTTRDLLAIGLYSRPEDSGAIKRILDTMNAIIEFSPEIFKGQVRYMVKRGDTLAKIGRKYRTTGRMIARINKIDNPNLIHEGDALKIILGGNYKVVIEKSKFLLTVFRDDIYIKSYLAGIGKEGEETPIGTTTITVKQIHPPWQPPGKTPIPYGHPEYPLGERWLGFDKKNFAHYGIHGTVAEDTLGRKASNGCIRLRDRDVEELFDIVPLKTTVVIKE